MIDVNLINDVKFATSFRGYDKDEVDQFLEELASMAEKENAAAARSEREVAELTARCERLESADEDARAERERMLAEAKKVLESARAKERMAASPDGAAAGAATQSKFESERAVAAAKQEAMRITAESNERARAHTEATNAAIRKAIATAKARIGAADAAARARAQESDRAAKERADASDRRAGERADAIIREAQGNADRLAAEAGERADRIVAEAQARAEELLRSAEASIAAKREEVERLRDVTREFSGEYNRLLSGQLREMSLLAEKVDGMDFGDISVGPEDELSIDDALEALKLDDIDSLFGEADSLSDDGEAAQDDAAVDGTADEDAQAAPAVVEDDDTYDFVGTDGPSDASDIDLVGATPISDDELDRIFSFDVEEIMNEDRDAKPDAKA